jgi:ATP-dependent RNA helicase DHX37/DHR1
LSDEGEEDEDEDEEMDSEEEDQKNQPLERKIIRPRQEFALSTTAPLPNRKSATPFNPSGAVSVIVGADSAHSSSISTTSVASTSSAPSHVPKPAAPPAAVGSALAAGATITVVKRKPKERGRMRQLIGVVGKGKGKAVEEEEESSEFDSSDASDSDEDDEEDEEKEGEDEQEEEWKGIEEGEGATKADGEEEGPESGSGEEDEDDEEEVEEEGEATQPKRRERGAFRAWADAQVLEAAGEDAKATEPTQPDDGTYRPLLPAGSGVAPALLPDGLTGPMGEHLPVSELPTLPPQRTVHIPVKRSAEIEEQRAELPVVKEESNIMATILGNAVVVLCGETGSGKTTQVGQFLWEAGFGDPSSGASPFTPCFLPFFLHR